MSVSYLLPRTILTSFVFFSLTFMTSATCMAQTQNSLRSRYLLGFSSQQSAFKVRMSLRLGADVNAQDDYGDTPLIRAIRSFNGKNTKIIEILLNWGADLNTQNLRGKTALIEAVKFGDTELVTLLLSKSPNLNLYDEEGNTALMTANHYHYIDIVIALLEAGANPNIPNKKGETVLMKASQHGYLGVVSRLLEEEEINVDTPDAEGNTAFIKACQSGYLDVANALLGAGADIDTRNEEGNTPLIKTVLAGYIHVFRMLLRRGAKVNARNQKGETALIVAIRSRQADMVRGLLEAEADPNIADEEERNTPLMEACKIGDPLMVQLLIDTKKVNVNAENKHGQTALEFLTDSVYGRIIKMLIDAGAHPYEVRYPNETALMISNNSESNNGSSRVTRFFEWVNRSCRKALTSGNYLLGHGN